MPLSRDSRKRERQLANLRPGTGAPSGNARARTHGAYAQVAHQRLDAKAAELFEALAVDAPLRDEVGELPRHDGAQVALLADVLCRLDDVRANVRDFGVFEQRGMRRGQVRSAVELEGRLRREASDYLDALGMTPRSRAKLGLDLQRGFDLAQHWAEEAGDDE